MARITATNACAGCGQVRDSAWPSTRPALSQSGPATGRASRASHCYSGCDRDRQQLRFADLFRDRLTVCEASAASH